MRLNVERGRRREQVDGKDVVFLDGGYIGVKCFASFLLWKGKTNNDFFYG